MSGWWSWRGRSRGGATGGCISCCGDSNFGFSPDPIFCPVGESMQCSSSGVDCNGIDVYPSSWSSSNTSVMTISSSGLVTGVSVRQATISANLGSVTIYTGQICSNPCPTANPAPSAPATVTPAILLGGSSGTDITDTTQNVVAGQQIVLYGKYTLPSGYTFSSQSWTVPGTGSTPPTAISNFTVGSDFTSGGPVSLTSSRLSQQTVTFYFVAAANSQQVTFTLNYVDNQSHNQTATATATFNIAGPSNSGVATQLGQVAINPGPYLQFGSTSGSNIGINFTASANQPAGYSPVFKWVNLISNDTVVLNGTQTTSLGTGFDVNPSGGYPSFPNVTANTTNDNPKYQLLPACTEVKRTFDAQTYLMWNASLTNPASIDVPLGSLTWGFSGDAVQNSGTWSLNGTPTKYAAGFTNSSSYPTWTSSHSNGLGPACP